MEGIMENNTYSHFIILTTWLGNYIHIFGWGFALSFVWKSFRFLEKKGQQFDELHKMATNHIPHMIEDAVNKTTEHEDKGNSEIVEAIRDLKQSLLDSQHETRETIRAHAIKKS